MGKTDDIKQYRQEYYKNNKEKFDRKPQYCSICNKTLTDIRRHNKSKYHQKRMNLLEIPNLEKVQISYTDENGKMNYIGLSKNQFESIIKKNNI